MTSTRFVPDGEHLLTAGVDCVTRLWPLPGPVLAGATDTVFTDPVDFTGTLLLVGSGSHDDAMDLWDVSDPDAVPQELSITGGVVDGIVAVVAFSPDGPTVAVATADNTVELWNVTSPADPGLRATLTGFTTYAQAVAFSPDRTLLAAGSADETVRVWDVDGTDLPTPAAALTAYGSRTFDARFGRGGLLVAAGPDGAVRLWSTDLDAAAEKICATHGTPLTDDEWARHLPGVPLHPLCS